MKDHLKNPNLYYMVVPAIVAIWALTAGFILYPNSIQSWEDEEEEYTRTLGYVQKIIEAQPKRLSIIKKGNKEGDFDFSETINTLAQIFKISTSNFSLNVRPAAKKAGKKARPATMTLKEVDVQTMARFLSTMLTRWPDLKCEVLSLEKSKASKNKWKVDLSLTYYVD